MYKFANWYMGVPKTGQTNEAGKLPSLKEFSQEHKMGWGGFGVYAALGLCFGPLGFLLGYPATEAIREIKQYWEDINGVQYIDFGFKAADENGKQVIEVTPVPGIDPWTYGKMVADTIKTPRDCWNEFIQTK